jgi:hypothetical protein
MAKIIIGIHGLGNKPPHKLLEQWWLTAINEGLQKTDQTTKAFTFRLVYWADILYPKPLNIELSDKEDPLYLAEPYAPSNGTLKAEPQGFKSRLIKYAEKQLDKVFLKEDMTLHFAGVTDSIIHKYFHELEAYYHCADSENEAAKRYPARDAIRQQLIEALEMHKKDDILLLSHSMGTIVAYEVLRDNPQNISINTFVTMGSPLGFPVVVSRIYADQKIKTKSEEKLKAPDNIRNKWFNLSDPEDMVALDRTLSDDYQSNKFGIRSQDICIFNDYEIDGERNPHKSFGYLRTVELAQIINAFLAEKKESSWSKYYSRIKKIVSTVFVRKKNDIKN